jgi:hypothetical protein
LHNLLHIVIGNCVDLFNAIIQLIRCGVHDTRTRRKLDVGGKDGKSRGN